MAWSKKAWKNRMTEYPTRRKLTDEEGISKLVTVSREEGEISQEGDAFSAENMNDLEKRVDEGFTEVNNNFVEMKTSFQAGVDALYNKCVSCGITPSNKTPTAIVNAIQGVSDNAYNVGRTQGHNDVTGNPHGYGLYNQGDYDWISSTQYNNGYAAGVNAGRNETITFKIFMENDRMYPVRNSGNSIDSGIINGISQPFGNGRNWQIHVSGTTDNPNVSWGANASNG